MKFLFTLLLLATLSTTKAQTPLCVAYHGCGGATVVAYQGDLGWSSITYDFQRFLGGSWVTIHQSIENFHLVIPGDIVVATQYRTLLRNNATSEERISNGVTVDPAKFNNTVIKPKPVITFYWGTSVTSGSNYVEVLPKSGGIDGMRPPFTYKIKKKNSFVFDQKISTTGIFFTFNIEANQDYVITVTDYCGQVDSVAGAVGFGAFGRVTARSCAGASIELSSVASGQNLAHRLPITFGLAPLADSINANNVPESVLAGLSYTYPAGISSGFTAKRYVVRARDAFGVLSDYGVVSTGLAPPNPFIVSIGPSAGYCNLFITLYGNYVESGIRRAGDNQPYTFTPGTTITNIKYGFTYDIVVKDSCGIISAPLTESFNAFSPIINNVVVTNTGCDNKVTVTATSCTGNPEYRLQLVGQPDSGWQRANVFNNVAGAIEFYTLSVRDGNSPIVSWQVYVPPFSAIVEINQFNGFCGSLGDIRVVNVSAGLPPYQYAISYDGINFSPYSFGNSFTHLVPGTYDVKVKDSCGNIFRSTEAYQQTQVGDWYYVNETGFRTTCTAVNEQAGGFIRFGIQQPYNIYGAITTPYQYELKEVIGTNGNSIQYGKVARTGQTDDTTFTISGLPAGKGYGIFITNRCGDPVTAKNRAVNNFFIPLQNLPEPAITVNSSNCSQPFIEVSNLPNSGVIKIFKGRDTTGSVVNLATPATSISLAGGYYTIKVFTPNFNGCPWMHLYEAFVSTTDSTSAGIFDVNQVSICKADSAIVQLKNYVLGQTPGGTWTGSIPDSNWVNLDSGQFKTTGLGNGVYNFEYAVQSLCGVNQSLTFSLPIDLVSCGLSWSQLDVISANTPLGCKNYDGDKWFDLLDAEGKLRYSINPGDGNNIQSLCWGARFRYSFTSPRMIQLNGSPVYFADRNFYIEPDSLTIGANPVLVRLYLSNDDIDGLLFYLKNNGYPAASVNDLRILKKKAGPGSPVDLELTVDAGAPLSLYTYITASVHRYGTGPFASWYFEFEVNSFSELALVYTTGNVLPVTWLSVTGNMTNDKALVQWSTASEYNTASFTIEHSVDGRNFTALQSMPAAGSSNRVKNYQFTHLQTPAGINFYRIKQIDIDGRYSYSSIIKILNRKSNGKIVIAPNPASNEVTIYFDKPMSVGNLRIYNSSGQMISLQRIAEGSQQQKIDVSKLPAGIYQLQVQTATTVETFKLMKQ